MSRNKYFLISYKLLFGLLGFSAVVTEIAVLVERGVFNPASFFSFFTIQTNILVSLTLILSALAVSTKKPKQWISTLRAATTVYILIVGIGFAVLLSGVEGLVLSAVPWDNIVLHYIIPIAVLFDFLIDRPLLTKGFRQNIIWLLFPIFYVSYSIIRGAITGWYPYPFLDPTSNGYEEVAVSMVGLLLLGVLLVWAVTRLASKRLSTSS